jgi:NitT/TauT family transport system permease protein
MSRLRFYQISVVAAFIVLLEGLCLVGVIDKVTMPPPHIILRDFVRMVLAGRYFGEIGKSLTNVLVAFTAAYLIGVVTGTALHSNKRVREILDPLFATYYAIPVFAFYPLFIVMFGLGDGPQVLIGFMLAIVAVMVTTLNGLDRVPPVLKKVARVNGLNALQTARYITLPFCAPYLLTAAKLALAYAFIGVIGSEFIMARSGMGYESATRTQILITRLCTLSSCSFSCCRLPPTACFRAGRGFCLREEGKTNAKRGRCQVWQYGHSDRRLISVLGVSLSHRR